MFKNIVKILGGDPNKKAIQEISNSIVFEINRIEPEFEKLSDEELKGLTARFKQRLADGETLDDLLIEAFAAVREASKRVLGMRHYDVQLICGTVLHQGKISEMKTGEGKTLAATLPMYLNALSGKGVHLVTVNDYLARRDARWMAPVFKMLDMKVGVLQMAARTDGAKNAFLVNLEKTSAHEDRHQLEMVPRKEAYQADITYGTNSEFGFDYLRDNQVIRFSNRVQRGHVYAIIDEVDNILIDEARTPLIISGPSSDDTEWYVRMAQVVNRLRDEDYEVNERDRNVALTEVGELHVEELLDMQLRDPERPEDINPEQARVMGFLEQALRAKFLFKRNKDYLVQAGKVIIVDSSTGRMMPGRRWSEGLHQSVEAKEGVRVNPENVTYATITLQNYYRMYEKLSGMTGTALTESEEFDKIYKLDVLPIPTNLEYLVDQPESELETLKDKDEYGYEYTYYARKDDPLKQPVYWKRKDYTDVVYRTLEAKLRAIVKEVLFYWILGRPQLVGTTSVENSEMLSRRFGTKLVRLFLQVLLIREMWMKSNNAEMVDRSVPELKEMNKNLEELNPGQLRNLVKSLGLDISLNLESEENSKILLGALGLTEEFIPRLQEAVKGGIPHMVLNARKHDEESLMIERAGAFGAVTIATNMAGRGVDIKLGGELPESVFQDINRVIISEGKDPFEMTNEEKREILGNIPSEKLSVVRAESVKRFIDYVDNMDKVKELGGLHVIGSERYEARRIDNQLRGRAARQGDPGSSRYYLSLEDDLMRIFGGSQVEGLWGRVFFDDDQPMEMRLLGRIVEQSQERVEGANFDARKHVLEYDDVLNDQRKRIYDQRDMVFRKKNLSEDILDMLQTELKKRIETGLHEEEGPWRLMAYLEQIQPSFTYGPISYPSFTHRLMIESLREEFKDQKTAGFDALKHKLLEIAYNALEAQKQHILFGTEQILENAENSYEYQLQERFDTLETILEGFGDYEVVPSSKDVLQQLSEFLHMRINLSANEVNALMERDGDVESKLRQQIETHLKAISLKRIIGSLTRRISDELEFDINQLQEMSWVDLGDDILSKLEGILDSRSEKLLGDNGQIAADLDEILGKAQQFPLIDHNILSLLLTMTRGKRVAFDKKTHRRKTTGYTRLIYTYFAAHLLEDEDEEEITQKIIKHLEGALNTLKIAWGKLEWDRLIQQFDATPAQLESGVKSSLVKKIGQDKFSEIENTLLKNLEKDEALAVHQILGARLQNDAYREILLRVISSNWIDYLTQIEALRISIRMEAYAQRDPLVQYKSKATEMFSELLKTIRMGVISRVFTYTPRQGTKVSGQKEIPAQASETAEKETQPSEKRKKRRKRH